MNTEIKQEDSEEKKDTQAQEVASEVKVEAKKEVEETQEVKEIEYAEYDYFTKLDMRFGIIRFVEPVEGTDKLLRCLVEFSTDVSTMEYVDPTDETKVYPVRQIVSGIRQHLDDIQSLVGKQVLYVINLKPRVIRGVESQGMLMAVGDENHPLVFVTPEDRIAAGSRIR